ncbi:alpha/beta hydrolase family protein [Archangium lansingense]|uniref:Platelet-activating factor acetylhydrolase n=1 Tax=Archangium lansingense TaxID=2995310 RepID=A0ABT3ZXL6_9BACT|nr:hypothetical protein [Archangium lansinium]MCY1074140.1 hypothetical protein [Archangium lansinium]
MKAFTRFHERHPVVTAMAGAAALTWLFQRLRAQLFPVILPEPTGPYDVGRAAFDWVDPQREEPYARRGNRLRELSAWLWYPAEPERGAKPGSYLPAGWRLTSLFWRFQASRVRAHAIPGAPVARPRQRHPVLVFSPAGFPPLYYSSLFEELASHGYIVAAVSHTYEALPLSAFADGRLRLFRPASVGGALKASHASHDEDVHARAEVVRVKAEDLRSLINELERLDAGSGLLAGRMDLERLGAFGHSMGGNAAVELCARDERCRAAANLDGGVWSTVGQEGLPKPLLELFAEHPEYVQSCARSVDQKVFTSVEYCEANREFAVDGWQRLYARALPGYSVQILGAGHASFTDCGLLPLKRGSFAKQALGTIEGRRMWRVLSDYLRAFFDRHLQGAPAPLLDGVSPFYPEAVLAPPASLFPPSPGS